MNVIKGLKDDLVRLRAMFSTLEMENKELEVRVQILEDQIKAIDKKLRLNG